MLITNKSFWKEIFQEGKRLGIPITKKRGIIREYLQSEILFHLYNLKESRYLIFNGGTSLRFLYYNQRLSEDLDFDVTKKNLPLKQLLLKIIEKIRKNDKTYLQGKITEKPTGVTGYFKYANLLYPLGLSPMPEEKLVIKFDFSYPEDKITPVKKVFSKFGYWQNLLTYDQSTLLSFKTRALFNRKMERGRDLYDIAKLLSFNIKPNLKIKFFKSKQIKTEKDYFDLLKQWYLKNREKIPFLKKQLQPFLINEEEINLIDLLFEKVLS